MARMARSPLGGSETKTTSSCSSNSGCSKSGIAALFSVELRGRRQRRARAPAGAPADRSRGRRCDGVAVPAHVVEVGDLEVGGPRLTASHAPVVGDLGVGEELVE